MLDRGELAKLSTNQLLARLNHLPQCEELLDRSDRDAMDDSGCIEFKQSQAWILAVRDVKQVLADREHIDRKTN